MEYGRADFSNIKKYFCRYASEFIISIEHFGCGESPLINFT